jgi:hypothetical protein
LVTVANRQQPRARSARRGRRARTLLLLGTIVVLALVALLWLARAAPPAVVPGAVAAAKVQGDPTAPIEIEEWGDFQ